MILMVTSNVTVSTRSKEVSDSRGLAYHASSISLPALWKTSIFNSRTFKLDHDTVGQIFSNA